MGRSIATKWIIGILIYFVILFLFLSMVNTAVSEYSLYDDNTISSTGGSLNINNIDNCGNPRTDATGESLHSRDSHCRFLVYSGAVYDQTSCEAINGTCAWNEKSDWLDFFTLGVLGSTYYTCEGAINITYYNDGEIFNGAGFDYVGATDNFVTNPSTDFCELAYLQDDRGICESWGCTWYPQGIVDDDAETGYRGALAGIWRVLTLRVTFATDNTSLNALFTLIFIWIPLIIMLFSVWIISPFAI